MRALAPSFPTTSLLPNKRIQETNNGEKSEEADLNNMGTVEGTNKELQCTPSPQLGTGRNFGFMRGRIGSREQAVLVKEWSG